MKNVIEKCYIRWLRLLTMLFLGRIYIAQGFWYFGDFRNIFLPNTDKDQKKFLSSERRSLVLCHMVNPALVISLRS